MASASQCGASACTPWRSIAWLTMTTEPGRPSTRRQSSSAASPAPPAPTRPLAPPAQSGANGRPGRQGERHKHPRRPANLWVHRPAPVRPQEGHRPHRAGLPGFSPAIAARPFESPGIDRLTMYPSASSSSCAGSFMPSIWIGLLLTTAPGLGSNSITNLSLALSSRHRNEMCIGSHLSFFSVPGLFPCDCVFCKPMSPALAFCVPAGRLGPGGVWKRTWAQAASPPSTGPK